jgi:carbamate kinase
VPGSALIAVGGNSLIRAGEKGTVDEQLANARRTAKAIVRLLAAGLRLVITHGNGPQVGAALLRSERAVHEAYGHPLDVCDATTQGEIGYLLQQSLCNEIEAAGLATRVVTLVTQVVVSADDPAMGRPDKPVGPFYSRADAEERALRLGWQIVEDAARGWRRVVPSPAPVAIVELDVIRTLVEAGVLVIAAGGGGIPVVRTPEGLRGVEAVIDKDRVSALLAASLGVDRFLISTDVDRVYVDYKRPSQRPLGRLTATEAERLLAAGQFPPGNMRPKMESAVRFVRGGGREAIITSCELLADAVNGDAGTHVVPG